MLLGLVLVVVIISVAMLFAILSSFMPFSNSYWNIAQYTAAYYSAISAIERGALAVKYAGPGFDWQSWWKFVNWTTGHTDIGNDWDVWSWDFFSYWNSWATTMYWEVQSSTTRIPKEKEWDVEPTLIWSGSKSENYNMLEHNKAELISLKWAYVVSDAADYYAWWWVVGGNLPGISWVIRLNPYTFNNFAKISHDGITSAYLCKWESVTCPWEKDQTRNMYMPMIDWVIKGKNDGSEFSIIPTESTIISSTSYSVTLGKDSVIRKNNIFQNVGWNPIADPPSTYTLSFSTSNQPNFYNSASTSVDKKQKDNISWLNIISTKANDLKGLSFSDIIWNWNTTNPYLSLELINYLWNNQTGHPGLYPFLEYYFDLGSTWTDRYYTIKWEWKVWKYNIKLQVKKPTMKDSSLWNFTIIF